MIIFRWQAHDSRVETGVSPQRNSNFSHQGLKKINIWFLRFSFGVIWKCPFRLNETHIFDIRTSKKSWTISRFFCRTAFLSLDATRCRSKSSNSARFHTLHFVSTYRSTPIWTSLDSSDLSGNEKFRFLERAFNLWSATVTEGDTFECLRCQRRQHTPTIC